MSKIFPKVSLSDIKSKRELKGDKDISEFRTLKDAVDYGYEEIDWVWFRIGILGIGLNNSRLGSRTFTKNEIGKCEKIGMSIYANHETKKIYSFSHFSNSKLYYKEFYRYTWV